MYPTTDPKLSSTIYVNVLLLRINESGRPVAGLPTTTIHYDDIRKHLPSLPYEGVTIRHLLHHTGGLPDYMGLFDENWDTETPIDERKTAFNKDLVELFSEFKPAIDFGSGERYEYRLSDSRAYDRNGFRPAGPPVFSGPDF